MRRQRRESQLAAMGGAEPKTLVVVLCILAFPLLLIVGRLVWLQIVTANELANEAISMHSNSIVLHAKRGTIYDRNGNVLAVSVDCKTIYANPSEIDDPSGVSDILVDVLGGDKSDYMSLLTQDTTFVYVRRQVENSTAETLENRLEAAKKTGVYFLEDTKREYPNGNVGIQVLGFVGSDGDGLTGLEKEYNDILTGTDGTMYLETGSTGTPIAGGASSITPAQNGTDIVISLDIELQTQVEEVVRAAMETYTTEGSASIVMNPKTGEILAACSTPLPDLDNLESDALNLVPISSAFEPGSVVKAITTSIGFDKDAFGPDSSFFVPAKIQVGDDWVSDADKRDYDMNMTVRQMLERSSNVGMIVLLRNGLGEQDFANGLERFQIGSITGIDYPGEIKGLFSGAQNYTSYSIGNNTFGQGLAIPMIQIIRAYGAIANSGVLLTPHFLVAQDGVEKDWGSGTQVISEEAAQEEIDVLRSVYEATLKKDRPLTGYDIALKTGTGQQTNESNTGYVDGKYFSSVCGFLNANNPEVVIYTALINTPHYAEGTATHMFHDIAEQAAVILKIPPTE